MATTQHGGGEWGREGAGDTLLWMKAMPLFILDVACFFYIFISHGQLRAHIRTLHINWTGLRYSPETPMILYGHYEGS